MFYDFLWSDPDPDNLTGSSQKVRIRPDPAATLMSGSRLFGMTYPFSPWRPAVCLYCLDYWGILRLLSFRKWLEPGCLRLSSLFPYTLYTVKQKQNLGWKFSNCLSISEVFDYWKVTTVIPNLLLEFLWRKFFKSEIHLFPPPLPPSPTPLSPPPTSSSCGPKNCMSRCNKTLWSPLNTLEHCNFLDIHSYTPPRHHSYTPPPPLL